MQSRLPLLLFLRQSRQGHERGDGTRRDRLAARDHASRAGVDGWRSAASAEVRPQDRRLCCGEKGFFIYIPTNGRLLKPDVIDRLADAGVATFNLAVDAVDEPGPGSPEALNRIRPVPFEDPIKKQYRYGYTVFFSLTLATSVTTISTTCGS